MSAKACSGLCLPAGSCGGWRRRTRCLLASEQVWLYDSAAAHAPKVRGSGPGPAGGDPSRATPSLFRGLLESPHVGAGTLTGERALGARGLRKHELGTGHLLAGNAVD